jgi:hypothetical protein
MTARRLSDGQRRRVKAILEGIRRKLTGMSRGDRELRFALNRSIYKALTYDERGTPAYRRHLKLIKFNDQQGRCAIGREALEPRGRNAELDRFVAVDGYTVENTRLVCHKCHRADQERKKFK